MHIDRKALDAAHYMLRPFLLRRVKTEVEQTLPSKLETLIRLATYAFYWLKIINSLCESPTFLFSRTVSINFPKKLLL